MYDYNSHLSGKSQEREEDITQEIIEMMRTGRGKKRYHYNNLISDKLKNLIVFGTMLANEQKDNVVNSVHDCLKTGATREQILQVLNTAILIAEIPAKEYNELVVGAIESFLLYE